MDDIKTRLREELGRQWGDLWDANPERPPVFTQAGRAAQKLRSQPEWAQARSVLAMADPVLLQVRVNALGDGKTLIAATPGLKQGLVRVSAAQLPVPQRASLLRGGLLTQAGKPLRFPEAKLGRLDLVVLAAMAVDPHTGAVLGDGRGLADVLWPLLARWGAITPKTKLVVLCATEQLREGLPLQPWDQPADLVITPDQATRTGRTGQRPELFPDLPRRLAKLPLVKATLQAVEDGLIS